MWDFPIGRTIGIVLRTWPYVLLRMVVYFGITLAYIMAVGTGAGVGYGTGWIFDDSGGPLGFAVWGGIIGFGLVTGVFYWLREYILYLVKAGHVAVLVHLVEGRPIPGGLGQLAYGRQVVTERFVEANVLFALDQLIKGALRAVSTVIGGFAAVIPIPGLNTLVGIANAVMRMATTYVDEIILAHNIRLQSRTPFETGRQGVVLYAQNGVVMLKNAAWLAAFIWLVGAVLFVLVLAPAGALVYGMPGQFAGWTFVFSLLFAWACIAAFVEPFAIAALMQVYFRAIEGQAPDPDWDRSLADASAKFRELKDRAAGEVKGAFGRSAVPN